MFSLSFMDMYETIEITSLVIVKQILNLKGRKEFMPW